VTDIAGHWAKLAIEKVVALGLLVGYPDGTLRPDQPITRAEFATILVRLIDEEQIKRLLDFATRYSVAVNGGAGVLIEPDLVLTGQHVTHDMTVNGPVWLPLHSVRLSMDLGGAVYAATPVRDSLLDLSLLRLPEAVITEGIPLAPGPSGAFRGQTVHVLGTPLGFFDDYCKGEVRHLTRKVKHWWQEQTLRALTAPINPGNSGGPVFNAWGELVGLAIAKIITQTVDAYTFMIPLPDIRAFLAEGATG
jgi:S1-C subfamily serine protease